MLMWLLQMAKRLQQIAKSEGLQVDDVSFSILPTNFCLTHCLQETPVLSSMLVLLMALQVCSILCCQVKAFINVCQDK